MPPNDAYKVQKAQITKVKANGTLDTSTSLVCKFNPKELSLGEGYRWVKSTVIGSNEPVVTFAGGEAAKLTIDLLFDTTDTGQDVRNSYKTLLEIAAVEKGQENQQTGKGEPARCQFQWGKLITFKAVIESISQRFTLFKPDGTPLRADVKVTFSQVRDETKGQNPTSRTEPRKVWVVREGERLEWIAYQEYGDPAYWRHIADTNDLANPLDLRPGQILQLVPLR
jgi:nucleoid-associated protein YgaU